MRKQFVTAKSYFKKNTVSKNANTVIIGDKERDNKLVSYRKYNSNETNTMKIDDFIKYIKEEIKKR